MTQKIKRHWKAALATGAATVLLFASLLGAQARDKSRNPGDLYKILDLTDMGTAAATDEFVTVQAASATTAKKISLAEIRSFAAAAANATDIDAGASGTAGSVDIFPATASKGKIALTAADSAGDTTTTLVNASQAAARTYTIPDAGANANFALNLANEAQVKTAGVSFTEDGSGTSYTATVEIPAGAIVHDICFTSTVLWDGTSASLIVGDDDDPNGWFTATDLKATALLVGEVLCAADDGAWGGVNGAYLTTAGRRGRVTAGVDSGWYYGAASEVIFLVTPGAADGSAGRSFGWVNYSVPTFVASTNV